MEGAKPLDVAGIRSSGDSCIAMDNAALRRENGNIYQRSSSCGSFEPCRALLPCGFDSSTRRGAENATQRPKHDSRPCVAGESPKAISKLHCGRGDRKYRITDDG